MLSTALIFLAAGALVGPGGLGIVVVSPDGAVVQTLADIALFTVLFVDGGRLPVRQLRAGWQLSGRARSGHAPGDGARRGAHALPRRAGLDHGIPRRCDPVADRPRVRLHIVSRSEVPLRLRRLLNIESGVNDGLALPFVLVLLAVATGTETDFGQIGLELLLGLLLGVGLPLVVAALLRLPIPGAEPRLQPLGPLALATVLYGLCHLTHANPYLAAFAAGITLATRAPRAAAPFHDFGDLTSELTKFAALLVFGALLTPAFVADLPAGEWAVGLLSLLLVRAASVLIALWRTDLSPRERYAAAWFGPKGFASVATASSSSSPASRRPPQCSSWLP